MSAVTVTTSPFNFLHIRRDLFISLARYWNGHQVYRGGQDGQNPCPALQ